jgi:hypothetical protein
MVNPSRKKIPKKPTTKESDRAVAKTIIPLPALPPLNREPNFPLTNPTQPNNPRDPISSEQVYDHTIRAQMESNGRGSSSLKAPQI